MQVVVDSPAAPPDLFGLLARKPWLGNRADGYGRSLSFRFRAESNSTAPSAIDADSGTVILRSRALRIASAPT